MSQSFLDQIVARKRAEVAERKRSDGNPESGLHDEVLAARRRRDTDTAGVEFERALRSPGVSVIAEIKRYSPTKPAIRPDLDPKQVAVAFDKGGAAAISVLTDGPGFGGSIEDIMAVRSVVRRPILRKDFIIDRYQIEEAAEAGANAVLLIAAILDKSALSDLLETAAELGLAALTEVHSEEELEVAVQAGARCIGVNNRDLHTFEVDLRTSLKLAPLIPEEVVSVAESGIQGPDDVRMLGEAGYDAILVGESVLRRPDVEGAVRMLVEGGKS